MTPTPEKRTPRVRIGSEMSSLPSWLESPRRNAPGGENVLTSALRGKLRRAPATPETLYVYTPPESCASRKRFAVPASAATPDPFRSTRTAE